eukprot:224062-Chlamydomonas_euryale.AAC.1
MHTVLPPADGLNDVQQCTLCFPLPMNLTMYNNAHCASPPPVPADAAWLLRRGHSAQQRQRVAPPVVHCVDAREQRHVGVEPSGGLWFPAAHGRPAAARKAHRAPERRR